MALVTAEPLVPLATPAHLESLGIARKAIQALPLAQRVLALRTATGRLITPIRKRYPSPITPTLDLGAVDATGMTGGATVAWTGGPATLTQDYAVTFASSTTYTLTPNAGAYGAAAGPVQTMTNGKVAVDGYTASIAGTVNPGDAFAFSTNIVQDPGIWLAVAQVAAWILLANRGVDPKTEVELRNGYDSAINWANQLGIAGEGELSPDLDRNAIDGGSYGPLGGGQSSPYAFLDDPSRLPS